MSKAGVLIISHGSRNEEWVKLVDEAINDMCLPEEIPVFSSFLEIVEGRLIQDGIDWLEQQGVTDIAVVPLFVSSGSTHIDEISYALGVQEEPLLPTHMERFERSACIHFGEPMDDQEEIATILYDKIKPLSVNPEQEIVLLVGHGSVEKGFHLRWRRGLEQLAERLKRIGRFDEVDVAMLLPDQAIRKMNWWKKRKPEHQVLIAPLFLSEGYFTNQVIPKRLEGFRYQYNGKAILPHPYVSVWLGNQAKRLIAEMK